VEIILVFSLIILADVIQCIDKKERPGLFYSIKQKGLLMLSQGPGNVFQKVNFIEDQEQKAIFRQY
jgi:hypothetical protein